MTRKHDDPKNQPCPDVLVLPGFTNVEIPCDLECKHKLPHEADVQDADGRTVKMTWRRMRG